MNLVITSALVLYAMLSVSQPTLIYGHGGNHHGNGNGRKHSAAALAEGANLYMKMQSGDVLVRAVRGANAAAAAAADDVSATDAAATAGAAGAAAAVAATPAAVVGGTKRTKNNKKLNKNLLSETQPIAGEGRRKHNERKYNNGSGSHQQQQQQHQQHMQQAHQHGGNRKQQRQMLKSQQQHLQQQEQPRKRSGGGKSKQAENAEKTSTGEKSPTTCRYAKSTWSECDTKTNMRTRTLTLKKGEANCSPTRTMQKRCKKACRYEKGVWSECSAGQMSRQDKLKSTAGTLSGAAASPSDAHCEPVRTISKTCKPGGGNKQHGRTNNNKERKHKDKGTRRNTQQA